MFEIRKVFIVLHCIIYFLAILLASILSFFTNNEHNVWVIGAVLMFLLVISLLTLQIVKIILFLKRHNDTSQETHQRFIITFIKYVKSQKYWYMFIAAEMCKLILSIHALSIVKLTSTRQFAVLVSVLVSVEGYVYIFYTFETPRNLLLHLYRSICNIAWIVFIMITNWWIFSLIAWYIFNDVTIEMLQEQGGCHKDFHHFKTILTSLVTFAGISFGNIAEVSLLYDKIKPGSAWLFMFYAFLVYYIMANILTTIFIEQYQQRSKEDHRLKAKQDALKTIANKTNMIKNAAASIPMTPTKPTDEVKTQIECKN